MGRPKKRLKGYREARATLDGLRRAERRAERERARKCDWDDRHAVLQYRRDRRHAHRQRLLDELVPDRRCGGCERIIVESRRWVLSRGRAVCRRCYARRVRRSDRIRPNRHALRAARRRAGMSQTAVAVRCGWTQPYQSKLESGRVRRLSVDALRALAEALGVTQAEITVPTGM